MEIAMQIKEQTFLREKDRLLGFIRNRVSSSEEAEDILQDVFYQFVAGFDTIESLDRVTSWLFSVARNKIIDRYRRESAPLRSLTGLANRSVSGSRLWRGTPVRGMSPALGKAYQLGRELCQRQPWRRRGGSSS